MSKLTIKGLASSACVLFYLLLSDTRANAQSLSPSAPSKEYVYFGGLLVAVEERGSGGTKAATTSISTSTTSSASGNSSAIPSAPPPPQPQLPGTNSQTSPQALSGTPVAPLATTTPPETHAAATSQ